MKTIKTLALIAILGIAFASCGTRVEPNFYGVLMENYGKAGKSDYSLQSGRVNDWGMGTQLFQVPAWEQRGTFNDNEGNNDTLHMKAADNTEFTARPLYTYKVKKENAVDVVFNNSRLGSGDGFMRSLENNVLEPLIYDLIKEESKKYVTDTLMATGGNLKFEQKIQDIVRAAFKEKGLDLLNFSPNLDFSNKVKDKIDKRNEVNTNVSVLDQQIIEQRKRNELAELEAQELIIRSKGLTPQILQEKWIEAWKQTKQPIYGNTPLTFFKNVQ